MVAGHEAELLAPARDTPHPAHVGPEGPDDLAGGLPHRLGEVERRGEDLHHGQERLRLPEPLGDLLIEPRLVQRRRGLGGECRGKLNLMLREGARLAEMLEAEDSRCLALMHQWDDQRGSGLEQLQPACRARLLVSLFREHGGLLAPYHIDDHPGQRVEAETRRAVGESLRARVVRFLG